MPRPVLGLSRACVVLSLLSGSFLSGCGDGRPDLVEAVGTIHLDGKPLEGAVVSFQPVEVEAENFGRPATAVTDASGKFSMGTYGPGGGVPPGKYAVGVQKREVVGQLPANYNDETPEAFTVRYRWVTPRKYADPGSSGLTAEVTSSGVEPPVFELETGGAKPEIELTGPAARANEP